MAELLFVSLVMRNILDKRDNYDKKTRGGGIVMMIMRRRESEHESLLEVDESWAYHLHCVCFS